MNAHKKAPAGTEAQSEFGTSNTTIREDRSMSPIIARTTAQEITFPGGRNKTHALEILAMLVRGEQCDQFAYHELTGYPIADFRTRVSELGLINGWQIDREWTHAFDHNGERQRCKHYWIDRKGLAQVYAENPELGRSCKALAYGREVKE